MEEAHLPPVSPALTHTSCTGDAPFPTSTTCLDKVITLPAGTVLSRSLWVLMMKWPVTPLCASGLCASGQKGGGRRLGMLFPTPGTQRTLQVLCGQKSAPCLAFSLDEVAAWFALVLDEDQHRSYFCGEKSHHG